MTFAVTFKIQKTVVIRSIAYKVVVQAVDRSYVVFVDIVFVVGLQGNYWSMSIDYEVVSIVIVLLVRKQVVPFLVNTMTKKTVLYVVMVVAVGIFVTTVNFKVKDYISKKKGRIIYIKNLKEG